MSILAECPECHRRQTLKRRLCKCGTNLDNAKRAARVNFWVTYRVGKIQKKENIGKSIEDARAADGKLRGQKKENRILDVKPEFKMTFAELSDWYLKLEKVKSLKSYEQVQISLTKFNSEFGSMIVGKIKPAALEDLQVKRKKEGLADATVDHEIGAARTMIKKACYNGLVGGDTLLAFQNVRKLLKRNANARKKVLSLDQFNKLMEVLPLHAKQILATGFYTGMRKGEIVNLTRPKVSLQNRTIQLEAIDTKTGMPRLIPIVDPLYVILKSIPKGLRDNHVFLYKGKPITGIRGSLEEACKKVGIPYGRFVEDGFVYHDLRHTFNTFMRKAGVERSVIMAATGHLSEEMFNRYNTIDEDDLKEGVGKFEKFLQNQSRQEDGKKAVAE